MFINFTFIEREEFPGSTIFEVYANKAKVGYLKPENIGEKKYLCWSSHLNPNSIRYQFRNFGTFIEVVEAMRKYKNEQGFEYLTIWNHRGGLAAELPQSYIDRAGFKPLPDGYSPRLCLK